MEMNLISVSSEPVGAKRQAVAWLSLAAHLHTVTESSALPVSFEEATCVHLLLWGFNIASETQDSGFQQEAWT